MKFSEKKALEIIEKYRLSPTTLNVWRHRDSIPDKYDNDLRAEIEGENEEQQLKNLSKALASDKFNLSSLCRMAEVNAGSVSDFRRGKGKLYKNELIALKKAINLLRNEVKENLKALDKKGDIPERDLRAFKSLLSRKELSWFVILGRDRTVWNRLSGWIDNKRNYFPYEDRERLKAVMLIFLAETAI